MVTGHRRMTTTGRTVADHHPLHLIDTGRLARHNDRWTVVRPPTDAVDRIASRLPPELRELFLTKGRVAVALDRRA